MTKALITGATGFIGRAVADSAARRGLELRLLLRSDKYIDQVQHLRFERAYGDVTDPESLRKACDGIDVVFHVAAMYSMWVRDIDLLMKTNVEGARAMVSAAMDAGVKKIIYTSSVSAIGHRDDGKPSDETVEWNLEFTKDPYTKSKHLANLAVNELVKQGAPVVTMHPTAPIGRGDIKPTPTGQMYIDFINGKVPVWFDGGFSVVDVEDCGEGHLLACEKARVGEHYILAAENRTLKELFDLTSELMGTPKIKMKVSKGMAVCAGGLMEWMSNSITQKTPVLTASGARMTCLPPFYDGSKAVRELGLKYTPIRESFEKMLWYFYDRGWIKRKPLSGGENGTGYLLK